MPTTFKVFSLGNLAIWDTAEGNTTLATGAVDAALGTYGSGGTPLYDSIQTFAPAGSGFGGGNATNFDIDNNVSNDQFSIDGGATQSFDAAMVFSAVITYDDGTTANITAVVFQDTTGNTYWAPEFADNADQAAIEAKPIVSLQLTTPIYSSGNNGYSLTANRADSAPLCFTPGVMIACPDGDHRIEDLDVGDLVLTMDNGPQPIRWNGKRTVAAIGRLAPVQIAAGTFGASATFEVSPQHRLLLQGPEADLLFSATEVLAAAKHLIDGDRIKIRQGGEVEYIHLLLDTHQVLWANGVATESLFLGKTGEPSLTQESRAEIETLFPELKGKPAAEYRTVRPVLTAHEAALWARQTAGPASKQAVAS